MKKSMLMIGEATPHMIDRFEKLFVVHETCGMDDLQDFLSKNGDEIEAVATYGHDGISGETIDALPNLKVISNYGVGYDAVDVKRALERGIQISHTPDVLNADVANTTILLMLAVSRRLLMNDDWVRSGKWKNQGNAALTRSIEGARVGLLGMGRIGGTIAGKLQAFSCEIAYHTRTERPETGYRYFDSLEALAEFCDYLIVIVPGGPGTKGIVNRKVLDALGQNGTLINVARGSVVDEQELVRALQEGRLGSAGLDVFEDEPNVPDALIKMENVVLTPHIGSATEETRRAMGNLTVDNLEAFFEAGSVLTPIPECRS